MGYQDRSYYRDPQGGSNPLMWLLTGSVHLFTVAGIHVRAHASLLVVCGLLLLFGMGGGYARADSVVFVGMLFVIVLLHEFGHCIGARIMGGEADEILMTPLGGLAFAMAPRRPLATFVTVAAGPLVNLLLMLVAAVAMYAMEHGPSWNPYHVAVGEADWSSLHWYCSWFFFINYALLLFNLLPLFPLDGGQLLQTLLWRPMGYFRSMMVTLTIGLFGGAALALVALVGGRLLTAMIAANCVWSCYQMRAQMKAAGPWAFQEEETDYSAAQWKPEKGSRGGDKAVRREAARVEREAAEERAEQERIDKILAKVSAQGMASLNFFEKRALKTATEKQRQRMLRRSGR